MYPGTQASLHPDRAAVIMARSGETITYAELDRRSNQLAHLLRAHGLQRLDHYASFMENHPRCVEVSAAAERAGLYITCVNSYLTAEELAYIINNSESKALVTTRAKRDIAIAAARQCPGLRLCLIIEGSGDDGRSSQAIAGDRRAAGHAGGRWIAGAPPTRPGTTGRPKGILRPLPEPPAQPLPLFEFLA
ncbi:MAG: AMP-binding protein [Burkholderiaceae bacterium]